MQNKYKLMGKLLNLTPKDMILMLDNFRELSMRDLELAKFYFDNNYLRAVVLAGSGKSRLHASIRDRIGNRIIKLKPLSEKDALTLVKNRLGSFGFVPEHIVKKIYKKSGKNVKKFLENCAKVCEQAAQHGAKTVTEEHLSVL